MPTRKINLAAKTPSRSVPPSIPPEVVPIAGLAEIVAADRLAQDFAQMKKDGVANIRRTAEALIAQGALEKTKIDDVRRTYAAADAGVTAQIQMRSKGIKKLSVDDQMALQKLKIPLKKVSGKTVLNPLYCGAAKPNEEPFVNDVLDRLAKLIKANPKAGIPSNLFVKQEATILPAEGALLKALLLSQGEREKALDILADIIVLNGDIPTVDILVQVLDKKEKSLIAEIDGVSAEAA